MRSASLKDQFSFMKKLSFLLSSGIPFSEALHIINGREQKRHMKSLIEEVISRIREGSRIHKAFDAKGRFLEKDMIRILESSELTGKIKEGVHTIAGILEGKISRKRKLFALLMYPMCIVGFSIVLISFLIFFVFPKILPLFAESDISLPLPTRILVHSTAFLEMHWQAALFSGIIIIASFHLSFKKEYLFKIPFLKKWAKLSLLHSFASSLSLFLKSGYTLVESLAHISETEKSAFIRKEYLLILSLLKEGTRFSKTLLSGTPLFSHEMVQFIILGEETGNLSETLSHFAHICEEDIKDMQESLFVLIEPALMVFLGSVIGFIALSLIGPIYKLTSSVSIPH